MIYWAVIDNLNVTNLWYTNMTEITISTDTYEIDVTSGPPIRAGMKFIQSRGPGAKALRERMAPWKLSDISLYDERDRRFIVMRNALLAGAIKVPEFPEDPEFPKDEERAARATRLDVLLLPTL